MRVEGNQGKGRPEKIMEKLFIKRPEKENPGGGEALIMGLLERH